MSNRIRTLDGLKGLMCIPIVFVHYSSIANQYGRLPDDLPFYNILGLLYDKGALFVTPFFWISGFLVERQYGKTINDISMYAFIKRRMKVLYPMTFASITIGIIISMLDKRLLGGIISAPLDFKWMAANYLLIHKGWFCQSDYTSYASGTWFICILLLCYLYYYLLSRIPGSTIRICVFGAIFVMGLIGIDIPVMWSADSMCAFFGGVLIYKLFCDEDSRIIRNDVNKRVKDIFYTCWYIILAFLIYRNGLTNDIMMLCVSPLLLLSAVYFRPLVVLLETRVVQVIGKLSMSVYLSHAHIQRIIYIILVISGTTLTLLDKRVWALVMVLCGLGAWGYYELVGKVFSKVFVRCLKRIFV